MQCTGKLKSISLDYITRKPEITLEINENTNFEEIQNIEKLNIEIKKFRQKRSLDANAYCWILIGKLADKLDISAIEVYKMAIKEIGPYEIVPVKNQAVERYIKAWEKNGLGWICENIGDSKFKNYTNLKAYYGSSSYDSKEMSRLIDTIVEDCKMNDIPTDTPEQIAKYKEAWK